MIFKDRIDAGAKLTKKLSAYKNKPDTIILGLPRGGVVTAYEVARVLSLPLDILVPRKIGAPTNPELAIGAITEDGSRILDKKLVKMLKVDEEYLREESKAQQEEAQRRLKTYRKDRPLLSLKGKTVIIIDDGIATGATMKAAISSAKAKKAAKIIVAVPVGPPETINAIKLLVDTVICLTIPEAFAAVGSFYEMFAQTSDEEVIALLEKSA